MLGPLNEDFSTNLGVMVNRFWVIPKGTSGQWRLIVDLSFPEENSVNDRIDSTISSLHYVKVDDAVKELFRQGHGSCMAKVDIQSAYRTVPVHPRDWWLLGMQWKGSLFVDTTLPFWLRSATKIFTAVADAGEWIVKHRGVHFILIVAPNLSACARDIMIMLNTFAELGLPVVENKLEGPGTCLTFLGIELDAVRLEMQLPREKLLDLQQTMQSWLERRTCQEKEMESLIGKLPHACKVIQLGKTFLCKVFEVIGGEWKSFHHIRLNVATQLDIFWWAKFA